MILAEILKRLAHSDITAAVLFILFFETNSPWLATFVIPAKAGIQKCKVHEFLDSRLTDFGNDRS